MRWRCAKSQHKPGLKLPFSLSGIFPFDPHLVPRLLQLNASSVSSSPVHRHLLLSVCEQFDDTGSRTCIDRHVRKRFVAMEGRPSQLLAKSIGQGCRRKTHFPFAPAADDVQHFINKCAGWQGHTQFANQLFPFHCERWSQWESHNEYFWLTTKFPFANIIASAAGPMESFCIYCTRDELHPLQR